MARKALDHFQNYEWKGSFWFLEREDVQFQGTVKYTPGTGLNIDLFIYKPPFPKKELAGKIMHGTVQQGNDITQITLFNVFLSNNGIMCSHDYYIERLRGSASILIQGFHFINNNFSKIDVKYEESLENIFLTPIKKEIKILKYNNNPSITLKSNNTKIALTMDSWGHNIFPEDDLDTIFFSNDEEKFLQLKQNIAPFIQEKNFELFKRTSLIPIFRIETSETTLNKLLIIEYRWRTFCQLILDNKVFPINIWLHFTHTNINPKTSEETVYNEQYPILQPQYQPINKSSSSRMLHHLPINIYSFGAQENDLSILSTSLDKWFQLNDKSEWSTILNAIRQLIGNNNFADTTRYVALISDIETYLNILGHGQTHVDSLIKNYADQKWKDEVYNLIGTNLGTDTAGQFFHNIRNAITHPKSAQKDNGKYWKVIQDRYLFQKCFAYLSGLFIKSLLHYFDKISSDSINKYTDQFIRSRASYQPIEYLLSPLT